MRVAAGPGGLVVDYREKLAGRGAYICPDRACVEAACRRDVLSRALRMPVSVPSAETCRALFERAVQAKVVSLLAMAAKAGKIAAGYSAVTDALRRGAACLVLFAGDLAEGTREKVAACIPDAVMQETMLSRDELGRLLGRELVGVAAVLDSGFARAIADELKRLKRLRNAGA